MAKKYASKAKATAAAKKTVKNLGSKTEISSIVIERESQQNLNMLLTWECSLSYIGSFDVDVEYLAASGHWIQHGGGVRTISPETAYYDKKQGDKYQYTFAAPSDPTVRQIRARIHAVSKTHRVTKYYKVKKKKKTVVESVTLDLAHWTAAWTGYAYTTAPALSDADKAKMAAPSVVLAAPQASLRADGGVRVSWSKPSESTVTDVTLYRTADGAGADGRVAVASGLPLTTLEFADAGVEAGHAYRYLLIPRNSNSDTWGPVGSMCDDVETRPLAPSGLEASAAGADSALLTWTDNGYMYCGSRYRIYRSDHADAWVQDAAGAWVPARDDIVEVANDLERTGSANRFTVTGLDAGKRWHFRIALEGDGGTSPLSEMASCVLATAPAAPTPAYVDAHAVSGDPIALAWTHNAEDGSAQTAAEAEVTATPPGGEPAVTVIQAAGSESASFDTSGLADGTAISWRVRTQGVPSAGWSPWAQGGAVTVHVRPAIGIEARQSSEDGPRVDSGEPLGALPLVLVLTAVGGTSQSPVSWAVELAPESGFRYVGDDGSDEWMAGGTTMLSVYVDANDPEFDAARQVVSIGAADAAFAAGVPLDVRAMVVMDTGLQSDWGSCTVTPQWDSSLPEPDASAEIMPDYTAAIWPSCEDPRELGEGMAWMLEGTRLTLAGPEDAARLSIAYLDGDGVEHAADLGEAVFPAVVELSELDGYASPLEADIAGTQGGPDTVVDLTPESADPHESYETVRYASDVELSVYRIGSDGTSALIASGLANDGSVVVTDPHPNFGSCWYRVCANSLLTDQVTFSDIELQAPFEFLLIQWGESTEPVADSGEAGGTVAYSCESVAISANVAPVERGRKDKTLNAYIGREYPVVDYGTQLGITGDTGGAFNIEVDTDVIPQLRKLSRAMEPAYVRWPAHVGGMGYWADVDVEVGHPERGAKASVRLSITRVEEASR